MKKIILCFLISIVLSNAKTANDYYFGTVEKMFDLIHETENFIYSGKNIPNNLEYKLNKNKKIDGNVYLYDNNDNPLMVAEYNNGKLMYSEYKIKIDSLTVKSELIIKDRELLIKTDILELDINKNTIINYSFDNVTGEFVRYSIKNILINKNVSVETVFNNSRIPQTLDLFINYPDGYNERIAIIHIDDFKIDRFKCINKNFNEGVRRIDKMNKSLVNKKLKLNSKEYDFKYFSYMLISVCAN